MGLLILAALTVGCRDEQGGGEGGGSTIPKSCDLSFEKSVIIHQIQNGQHLFLNIKDLEFLTDPTLILSEVKLEVEVEKPKWNVIPLRLAVNGLKVVRRDQDEQEDLGGSGTESTPGLSRGRQNPATKPDDRGTEPNPPAPPAESSGRNSNPSFSGGRSHPSVRETHSFSLHKMFFNGGISFFEFLTKLRKNRGTLRISFLSSVHRVVTARLVFKGRLVRPCPKVSPNLSPVPSPTPTPTPPPAETRLESIKPKEKLTNSTTIEFGFWSPQAGSDFRCRLDAGLAEPCASPKIYSALTDGAHRFEVWALNSAGQVGPVVGYDWEVDTVAPDVTLTNLNTLPVETRLTEISFEFFGASAVTYECRLDGGGWIGCSSPHGLMGLSEGAHEFEVRGVDAVGNKGLTPVKHAWRVDLSPPVVQILSIVPPESVSSAGERNISFSANETSTFECSFDHGAFASCVSPVEMTGLAEGYHSLEIRALDLVGHVGSLVSHDWVVDQTSPKLNIGSVVPAAGRTNSQQVSVSFELNEAGEIFCSWDGSVRPCASPFVVSGFGEGAHTLEIWGQDLAGNRSTLDSVSWLVDLTAPEISIEKVTPQQAEYINEDAISILISGAVGESLFAARDGGDWQAASNPVLVANLIEGAHRIEIRARDSVGNWSNTLSYGFVVDLTVPTINLAASDNRPVTQADRNEFQLLASEIVNWQCELDSAGLSSCSPPVIVSGLADGSHEFRVIALDRAGNLSDVKTYRWTVDTVAPTTTLRVIRTGNRIDFDFSSSETSATFECSSDGAPRAVCASPIIWSPISEGTHNFSVWSRDEAGNVDPVGATHIFTQLAPISTRIIDSVPTGPVTNLRDLTVNFEASRLASGFVCSWDHGAETTCSSPATKTGLSDGPHHFQVWAIDEFGGRDPIGAQMEWSVDGTAPLIIARTATTTRTSITVTWTTDEPSTGWLEFGALPALDRRTVESSTYTTTHTVVLDGLLSNTVYNVRINGRDAAGNTYSSTVLNYRTNR